MWTGVPLHTHMELWAGVGAAVLAPFWLFSNYFALLFFFLGGGGVTLSVVPSIAGCPKRSGLRSGLGFGEGTTGGPKAGLG